MYTMPTDKKINPQMSQYTRHLKCHWSQPGMFLRMARLRHDWPQDRLCTDNNHSKQK